MDCFRRTHSQDTRNRSATFLAMTAMVLLHPIAWADPAQDSVAGQIEIEGKKVEMIRNFKHHFWISKSCLKNRTTCTALIQLKKLRNLKLHSSNEKILDNAGGANPAASVCLFLEGKVRWTYDADGNQNSFCLFSDGSVISAGTLQYFRY